MREEVKDVPKPAQIARLAPDFSLLEVTSLNSDTVTLIEPTFVKQTANRGSCEAAVGGRTTVGKTGLD